MCFSVLATKVINFKYLMGKFGYFPGKMKVLRRLYSSRDCRLVPALLAWFLLCCNLLHPCMCSLCLSFPPPFFLTLTIVFVLISCKTKHVSLIVMLLIQNNYQKCVIKELFLIDNIFKLYIIQFKCIIGVVQHVFRYLLIYPYFSVTHTPSATNFPELEELFDNCI